MYRVIFVCLCAYFSLSFGDDVKVRVGTPRVSNNENELITLELTKFDAEDETNPHEDTLLVQLRIHLVSGQVHLNGRPIPHGGVNSIHLHLTIIKVENGIKQEPKMLPVNIRIMIIEGINSNGEKLLLVEAEFVSVEDYKVKQLSVIQVGWRNATKFPVDTSPKIHQIPTNQDDHLYLDDALGPHYDDDGYGYDPEETNKFQTDSLHCRQLCYIQHWNHSYSHHKHDDKDDDDDDDDDHHDHKKHGYKKKKHCHKLIKFKCWYHCLSTAAKIALFSVSLLAILTMVLCCALCCKRRSRARALRVRAETPVDDNVDVKKKNDESFDFHFQFDNKVVVDDGEKLIKDDE